MNNKIIGLYQKKKNNYVEIPIATETRIKEIVGSGTTSDSEVVSQVEGIFYIDEENGSDDLDEGRGLSEDKPFKTFNYCLDYINNNYSKYKWKEIYIKLMSDIHLNEFTLNVPKEIEYFSISSFSKDYSDRTTIYCNYDFKIKDYYNTDFLINVWSIECNRLNIDNVKYINLSILLICKIIDIKNYSNVDYSRDRLYCEYMYVSNFSIADFGAEDIYCAVMFNVIVYLKRNEDDSESNNKDRIYANLHIYSVLNLYTLNVIECFLYSNSLLSGSPDSIDYESSYKDNSSTYVEI